MEIQCKKCEINHTEEACSFLPLYDSMKDKPAEINALISHSRSSDTHCRPLTGGGRCSVKDRKLKIEKFSERNKQTYKSKLQKKAKHLFISRLTSVPLLSSFSTTLLSLEASLGCCYQRHKSQNCREPGGFHMNCFTHAHASPPLLSVETYSTHSGFPSCKIQRLMSGNEPETEREKDNNSIITSLM